MNICICDNEAADIRKLESMLRHFLDEHRITAHIECFRNADELMRRFKPDYYQILFLDIYMPGTDGMSAAEAIREIDLKCELIFTTTSADHALQSYAVRASGYLLKPYSQRQLDECLEWCVNQLSDQLKALDIISDRERISVALRDIYYIEVYGRTSIIHTANAQIPTNRSLSELKEGLTDAFLQCHRSYVVNMEHIIKPEGKDFLLTGGMTVPITIDSASKIKQSFFDWTFRRTWESR